MRKLLFTLFVSMSIPMLASDQYIYPPGNDSPIQHWLYPSTTAMNTDTGFYAQDVYKIALNQGDNQLYYLSDPYGPTWLPLVLGGGGGGGNVSTSGTPVLDQTAVWQDATHIAGKTTLSGGTGGQVLTKIDASPYNWNWATAPGGGGGGTVTNVATTSPILGGPITVTGTISLDPTSKSNWDTGFSERRQWDGGNTNLVAATARSNLGLVIGTNVEAWDADLDALGALTGTNTIYYRSAANTWSPVLIGGHMTFSGGTLDSAATGTGTVTSITTTAPIEGGPITTTGAINLNVTSKANWDTAFSQARQWDGNGGAWLAPATARTTLQLNAVTNDVQTQAVIMPNTLPSSGQIPVGNLGGTAYAPKSISGSGATISLGNSGILTISSIPNTTLSNSSMTITGDVVSLGGSITLDQITGVAANGYLKRSGLNNLINITSIPIADLAASSITVGNSSSATLLGSSVSMDAILGTVGQPIAYLKRTASNTLTSVTAIPNADLANSSITVGNASTATSLGGSVVTDQIMGMTGLPAGIVKRSATNTYINAVAGTDYKVGTQNTINVRMVTTTSTFTPSAGVTAIYVEGVGGGGGGGGSKESGTSCQCAGGGGGGGGFAAVYQGTPAGSYSVTIGAGGTAGTAVGGNGGNGGTTTFGAVLSAGGGAGGSGCTPCYAPPAYGAAFCTPSSPAGAGTIGDFKTVGSDGTAGFIIGQPLGGTGGGSYFGGATEGLGGQSAGSQGSNYGGGGSGGSVNSTTGAAGGVGGPGIIRVWEIF